MHYNLQGLCLCFVHLFHVREVKGQVSWQRVSTDNRKTRVDLSGRVVLAILIKADC